jgi:hypothetical protein
VMVCIAAMGADKGGTATGGDAGPPGFTPGASLRAATGHAASRRTSAAGGCCVRLVVEMVRVSAAAVPNGSAAAKGNRDSRPRRR